MSIPFIKYLHFVGLAASLLIGVVAQAASPPPPKPVDQKHAEISDRVYRARNMLYWVYKVPIDYLDDSDAMQERLDLADTLSPVDVNDLRRNPDIQCTPLTCHVRNGQADDVIGYNPVEYEKLKTQLAAAPRPAIRPSGQVKVIGQWQQYPVYDFKERDVDISGQRPSYSGGRAFLNPIELAGALTPVDKADIAKVDTSHGIGCVLLCYTYDTHQIIGYDPVAYAQLKSKFRHMGAAQVATFNEDMAFADQSRARVTQEKTAEDRKAQDRATWAASYNPPPMKNPSTASGVPVDVIRNAIAERETAFNLTTWTETNTYVLDRNGESMRVIEFSAQWDIKKENAKYVNSGGGIDFRSATARTTGKIGLVKRGNGWYLVSK